MEHIQSSILNDLKAHSDGETGALWESYFQYLKKNGYGWDNLSKKAAKIDPKKSSEILSNVDKMLGILGKADTNLEEIDVSVAKKLHNLRDYPNILKAFCFIKNKRGGRIQSYICPDVEMLLRKVNSDEPKYPYLKSKFPNEDPEAKHSETAVSVIRVGFFLSLMTFLALSSGDFFLSSIPKKLKLKLAMTMFIYIVLRNIYYYFCDIHNPRNMAYIIIQSCLDNLSDNDRKTAISIINDESKIPPAMLEDIKNWSDDDNKNRDNVKKFFDTYNSQMNAPHMADRYYAGGDVGGSLMFVLGALIILILLLIFVKRRNVTVMKDDHVIINDDRLPLGFSYVRVVPKYPL